MYIRNSQLVVAVMLLVELAFQPASAQNAASGLPLPDVAVPVAPTHTAPDPAEPADNGGDIQFSYGSSGFSVMFMPEQMKQLKNALRLYESVEHPAQPQTFATAEPLPPVEKPAEPESYPVFFLSSIAYDGPNDWALWVSGHKITSYKNDTDVKVVAVTRYTATFAWNPSYSAAIRFRARTNGFASTDKVKNKLAAVQNIEQDVKTGGITFTLRQNQSFVVGYCQVFEGYLDSPVLGEMAEESLDDKMRGTLGSGVRYLSDKIQSP